MSDCYKIKKTKTQKNDFSDSYNYINNLPKFHKYRKKGTVFDSIYTIEDNMKRTSGILITGNEKCTGKNDQSLQLGDSYYFKSGKCGNNSSPKCIGKDRHIIIDNLPANRKNNKGLIPSIIGDITDDLNPGNHMLNIVGKGKDVNDSCSYKKIEFLQHYPKSDSIRKKTKSLCVPDNSLSYTTLNENFITQNNYIKPQKQKTKNRKKEIFLFILLICLFYMIFI